MLRIALLLAFSAVTSAFVGGHARALRPSSLCAVKPELADRRAFGTSLATAASLLIVAPQTASAGPNPDGTPRRPLERNQGKAQERALASYSEAARMMENIAAAKAERKDNEDQNNKYIKYTATLRNIAEADKRAERIAKFKKTEDGPWPTQNTANRGANQDKLCTYKCDVSPYGFSK